VAVTTEEQGSSQSEQILLPRWAVAMALALILCATALVRIRLLNLPLERDEGEYAYAGQLMLQGIPPYKLAYNMKLPGTYAAYALIMAVFGETTRGIHIGLIIVNSVTILLLYLLGRRLFGQICGLVAAGSFALLALSNSVFGLAAHATHFVTLFALAGSFVLLRAVENQRITNFFGCGLLFGLAFVMKQPAIFFVLFAGICIPWMERSRARPWRRSLCRLAIFSAAAALPFALTCVWLAAAGVFDRFWFWSFSYAQQYLLNPSLWYGWRGFEATVPGIIKASPGLWLLTVVGMWLAFTASQYRRPAFFTLAFFLTALATAVLGFYFRGHYFIPVLAATALFIGAGAQVSLDARGFDQPRLNRFAIPALILLLAVGHTIFHHRALFFRLSPADVTRATYGVNPFVESVKIAQYIREHSRPDSLIAVVGSEPQIYFYSMRHSATGYIYTYGLMETHRYALRMQQEMMAEIEAAKPEFVVLVHVPTSWLERKGSSPQIFEWAEKYARANLRPVMLVDIESLQRTVYHTNDNGVTSVPSTNSFIWVLKRNDHS
jgi:4-amino-4-deoxy-L-arabinose transferase-like glycosyltransferase